MTIGVLVVDDHPVVLTGLAALISSDPGLSVVGTARSCAAARELAHDVVPDVAVLDLQLPDGDGIALGAELKQRWPGLRVLILTMHASQEYVLQAFATGVHGYALKGQPAEEVLQAIHMIADGDRYLAPEMPRGLLEPRRGAGPPSLLQGLSPREREIFDLAVQGFTNEAIGVKLGISVKTVETHRAHVNRKLGVHSAAELIRFAARRGLVI